MDLPQGEVMSVRNGFVLLVALSALTFLIACGGNSGSIANPVAPPTGGFSTSTLNGTYVFSVSGIDANDAPIAIAGTFTANGSGKITGGAIDINDAEFTAPTPNLAISSSSYTVTVDGRGSTKLNVTTPFGSGLTLDFALQDNAHGLVSEFDGNATGSGSMDLQTSGVTPAGSYAFTFSGAGLSSGTASLFATVGNFTLGSGGAITGVEDFNDGGFAYADQALSGQLVLGPSSTPATTLVTRQFQTQTYDVFAVDATHLKFIEMDAAATLVGDAFSQTSTTIPTGALAFTMAGSFPGGSSVSAAGGFIVTDGAGNITSASTEDANNAGTASPTPVSFSGAYTSGGRSVLTLTGFSEGTSYAAYPSSGGLLLLEIDDSGVMTGAAFAQSSTTLSASQGYALSLSGENLGGSTGSPSEVDDIAEFAAASAGTLTGVIDENSLLQTVADLPLTGTFVSPDTNGRGQISANAGSSSSSTLNGGFLLNFYTVDGTTFPFIETDGNQVSTGVFVQQTASAASGAIAKSHNMFVPHPLFHPHTARSKQK
jgi:hypothetical protein